MYLEENYYLHKSGKVMDEEGAIKLLEIAFPGISLLRIQGSARTAVFLSYLYLGHYITLAELAALVGPYFYDSAYRVKFSRRSFQSTTMHTYTFPTHDLDARRAYCMTKDGFAKFMGLVGGDSWVTKLPTPPKIRRQTTPVKGKDKDGCPPLPVTACHDYALGVTLLSFLNVGLPFVYDKEFLYTMPRSTRKDKGSLCVDACIRMDYGRFRDIYVEQDMSTEPAATLTSKLCLYKEIGIAHKDSCVLFSIHCPTPLIDGPYKKQSLLTKILETMKSENQTLLEFYRSLRPENPLKQPTKNLLDVIGLGPYGKFMDEHVYPAGTPAPDYLEGVDYMAPVADYWEYEYGEKVAPLFPGDFTVEDMERYIEDLQNHTNPYVNRLYDLEQIRNTWNRFVGVCATLMFRFNRCDFYASDLRLLLSGYHAYMLPSIMIANKSYLFEYMEHGINAKEDCEINRWRRAVEGYYPGIMESNYEPYSPAFDYSSYGAIHLRHCFRDDAGHLICFEQVGCDLGAYLRCWALTCAAYQGSDFKVHIVCVCDTVEEALYFARNTGSFVEGNRFDGSDPFFVSFLFAPLLKRDFCPLYVFPPSKSQPVPLYTEEMEQKHREAIIKGRQINKIVDDAILDLKRAQVEKMRAEFRAKKEKEAALTGKADDESEKAWEEIRQLLSSCDNGNGEEEEE